MALAPIAFAALQYEDFANQYIKAFEQGTTTPLTMATDITGDTTASKFQLNAQGFPVTAGSALVIPFIDGAYDLWIIPTAAEADANDTTNALQIADNINPFSSGKVAGQEATIASMIANTNKTYILNDIVEVDDRGIGSPGRRTFDVVLTSAITPNVVDIFTSTVDGTLSFVERREFDVVNIMDWIDPIYHQAIRDDTTASIGGAVAAITASVQAAFAYYEGAAVNRTRNGVSLYFPGGIYKFDDNLRLGAWCRIVGEHVTTTLLGWEEPFAGNCLSLGPDKSGDFGFSEPPLADGTGYTFGTGAENMEIFGSNNCASVISCPGVHQFSYLKRVYIKNVNNIGIAIGGNGGSAQFSIEDYFIIAGTGTPTSSRIGINSGMNSIVSLTKGSIEGNASNLFDECVFIADGGHIIDDLHVEFSDTGVFFHSGASDEYMQMLRGVTGNFSSKTVLKIDAGFPGSIHAEGTVGPFFSGTPGALCIENLSDTATNVARDRTVPLWQWGATSTTMLAAQMHTVEKIRFTDSTPVGVEESANLSAYSHGTWTPNITQGVTTPGYATQRGTYTRMGEFVYCTLEIVTNAGSGAASRLTIDGLPFAAIAASSTDACGGGVITFTTAFNAANPTVLISAGSSSMTFFQVNGASFDGTDITTPSAFSLQLTVSYHTDD